MSRSGTRKVPKVEKPERELTEYEKLRAMETKEREARIRLPQLGFLSRRFEWEKA